MLEKVYMSKETWTSVFIQIAINRQQGGDSGRSSVPRKLTVPPPLTLLPLEKSKYERMAHHQIQPFFPMTH